MGSSASGADSDPAVSRVRGPVLRFLLLVNLKPTLCGSPVCGTPPEMRGRAATFSKHDTLNLHGPFRLRIRLSKCVASRFDDKLALHFAEARPLNGLRH